MVSCTQLKRRCQNKNIDIFSTIYKPTSSFTFCTFTLYTQLLSVCPTTSSQLKKKTKLVVQFSVRSERVACVRRWGLCQWDNDPLIRNIRFRSVWSTTHTEQPAAFQWFLVSSIVSRRMPSSWSVLMAKWTTAISKNTLMQTLTNVESPVRSRFFLFQLKTIDFQTDPAVERASQVKSNNESAELFMNPQRKDNCNINDNNGNINSCLRHAPHTPAVCAKEKDIDDSQKKWILIICFFFLSPVHCVEKEKRNLSRSL